MPQGRIGGQGDFLLAFKERDIRCLDDEFLAAVSDAMDERVLTEIFDQIGFGQHQRLRLCRQFEMFRP